MSRHFCVTWNNPPLSDQAFFDQVTDLFENEKKIRYCLWQRERGEQGTEHFQIWVILNRDQRYSYLARLWPGCHVEIQRGSDEQAEQYVRKEETRVAGPWSVGDRASVGQGARTDWKAFCEKAFILPRDQLSVEFPGHAIRYGRGVDREITARMKDRTEAPFVRLYFGPAGCGKTYAAVKWAKDHKKEFFILSVGRWFDGYAQQPVVILDELDKEFEKFGYGQLLRILDRYPYRVDVKGTTMVPFNSPFVFITASEPPRVWCTQKQDYQQIERRIDEAWFRENQQEKWAPVPMWKPIKAEPVEPEVQEISDEENVLVLHEDGSFDWERALTVAFQDSQ